MIKITFKLHIGTAVADKIIRKGQVILFSKFELLHVEPQKVVLEKT